MCITSYNPPRIFGVYPRKGTIQPGADADMVIVDMNKEAVISNETTYTKVGWTPYHGRKVKGVPNSDDIERQDGDVDGKIVGKPGDGKFVTPVAHWHSLFAVDKDTAKIGRSE